ncbi:hypothetical protein M3Y97_00775100 [Aphelenchoides bicaudatus]|nr:hypothetical protein M3Y97_00775100 [Aphelenchoides bicaudatus]
MCRSNAAKSQKNENTGLHSGRVMIEESGPSAFIPAVFPPSSRFLTPIFVANRPTKANVLKRELPKTEAIVYDSCSFEAKSPSALAKCVVQLLNARDNLNEPKEEESHDAFEPRSQAELYSKMQSLIYEVLGREKQEEINFNVDSKPVRVFFRPKKAAHSESALRNLQRIQRYTTMMEKYNKQLTRLNEDNAKFINQASLPNVQFKVQPKYDITMMDRVMELINSFQSSNTPGKLSILSPKFFPIMPSRKNRPHLLSPTLFSFQQDGYFSLPQLFQMASIGRNETNEWIETLLTVSGAARELEKIVKRLEPDMTKFEQNVYPKLIELERWQRQLKRVKQTYTPKQKEQLDKNGYTFLTADQMSLVYTSPLAPNLSNEAKLFARLTDEQREKRIEDDIRSLAKLSSLIPAQLHETHNIKTKRQKRAPTQVNSSSVDDVVELTQNLEVNYGPGAQRKIFRDNDIVQFESTVNSSFNSFNLTENCNNNLNETNCSPLRPPSRKPTEKTKDEKTEKEEHENVEGESEVEREEREELPKFETLKPFAFGSRFNEAVVLEGLTLSPYAFFSQIMQPEMLNFEILSPRAFIPSVLSPSALIARVLSPAAFRAEILSPRTLVAWVLVPEALILEVLSPKAIETRIASPEALIIQVLSPNTLAPKVWSPEAVGLVVLSPSFLSPRIQSGEKMMVEVLSPNILGGGSEESKEHGSHEHAEHSDQNAECCVENGSGEHPVEPINNVQPVWHLKKPNFEQDLPTHDSTSQLSMHDWEH